MNKTAIESNKGHKFKEEPGQLQQTLLTSQEE